MVGSLGALARGAGAAGFGAERRSTGLAGGPVPTNLGRASSARGFSGGKGLGAGLRGGCWNAMACRAISRASSTACLWMKACCRANVEASRPGIGFGLGSGGLPAVPLVLLLLPPPPGWLPPFMRQATAVGFSRSWGQQVAQVTASMPCSPGSKATGTRHRHRLHPRASPGSTCHVPSLCTRIGPPTPASPSPPPFTEE